MLLFSQLCIHETGQRFIRPCSCISPNCHRLTRVKAWGCLAQNRYRLHTTRLLTRTNEGLHLAPSSTWTASLLRGRRSILYLSSVGGQLSEQPAAWAGRLLGVIDSQHAKTVSSCHHHHHHHDVGASLEPLASLHLALELIVGAQAPATTLVRPTATRCPAKHGRVTIDEMGDRLSALLACCCVDNKAGAS